MKKILYFISLLAICLLSSSCSTKEEIGLLTIEGDNTFFSNHHLESFRQIAQQEKINILLLIVPDSVPSTNQLMNKKGTFPFFRKCEQDAIITYFEYTNMVLVDIRSEFDVPMQKEFAKELFRIQAQHKTLPGYQAIDGVMHIIAQAKHKTRSSWKYALGSFFSNVRDGLQWVLSPSDKWFFQILFKPAFKLCQLNIRLFHSLRWAVIILIVFYFFLSIFKVFKPETNYLCTVLRTLVLIMLVYTLLFCTPSFDNYLIGKNIRNILYTSYISSTPKGGSIGWGILAIILVVLDHFRKLLIATEADLKEGKFVSTRQDLEINNFSRIVVTFASVFVLPKIFLQAACLILGSMLLTDIIEDMRNVTHSNKNLSLEEDNWLYNTIYANVFILLYFLFGFIFFLHNLIAIHQPWAWLESLPVIAMIYAVGAYVIIFLAGVSSLFFLCDFSESHIQYVSTVQQAQAGHATMDDIRNALKKVGKSALFTLGAFAVWVLGLYLLLRYYHV